MRTVGMLSLIVVMLLGLTGCPSKGEPVYSSPDAARERAGKATQELDRDTRR